MKAQDYINVVLNQFFDDNLPLIYIKKLLKGEMLYQQDNVPCHRAAMVEKWFQNNRYGKLNWPPQSPDLNPIENLWSMAKKKLDQKN